MAIYRYRQDLVNFTRLARLVGGTAPTLSAASPNFVDISYTGTKADLDEVMADEGFAYVSTTPSDTPTQAVATTLGVAASTFDVRDVILDDHFFTGSGTTERIGKLGWLQILSGTGSDMQQAGVIGHPGVLDFGPGTAAAGRAGIYLGDTTYLNMLLGSTQAQIDMEWLVDFTTTSLSSANNERWVLGFGDTFDAASGVELTNGIYAEHNPAISANFALVTTSGGTRTRTASSIAVAASTWYRIGLRITYPSNVPTAALLINGTVRATNTANFPSSGLGVGVRMDANAGTEPRYRVDYMKLTQVTTKET